jgi:NADH-quinone oxidoreductase subunit L
MGALTLIVLLPLLGFVLNGLFGNRGGHVFVNTVGCGLPILSFLIAVKTFMAFMATGTPIVEPFYSWATIDVNVFDITFYFDRLTAVMVLIVTGVGSLIHIYSVGYMHKDSSYARFFAYLNLFLFFMLMLVLGRSLLVLFVGWEGVGLASYLLIGFWFEDPANAAAGKKAFIANRIGDAGFLLGMFVLYTALGTLEMDKINAAFLAKDAAPALLGLATLVGILLFIGATGKSAQIPLYVWLPDAMAGPTPVSALIHAATMVTAGVYMTARMSGIYLNSATASAIIAIIGAATAFMAATIAVTQNDIKKVLAYSTVSQLGFMFVAVGVGAYGVAVFHLYTHAFFKACLFLGAGSVIHAMSGEQDIRKMGALAKKIPVTFTTFMIATAAISGIPFLSGFFSKDEILLYSLVSPLGAPILFVVMALAALMTAFYMFRLLWLTFFGTSRVAHEVEHHIHESPWTMTGVLVVLAFLSIVGGYISIPHFLEPQLPLPNVEEAAHHFHWTVVGISVAIGAIGLLGAWFMYGGGRTDRSEAARKASGPLYALSLGKYYIDEFYDAVINKPLLWLSEKVFLNVGDRALIDGTLNGLAALAQRAAGRLGRVQTGNLQLYVLLVLLGIVGALVWSWRHV